jgi:hypothetical protein
MQIGPIATVGEAYAYLSQTASLLMLLTPEYDSLFAGDYE